MADSVLSISLCHYFVMWPWRWQHFFMIYSVLKWNFEINYKEWLIIFLCSSSQTEKILQSFLKFQREVKLSEQGIFLSNYIWHTWMLFLTLVKRSYFSSVFMINTFSTELVFFWRVRIARDLLGINLTCARKKIVSELQTTITAIWDRFLWKHFKV